ncbi:MAG: FAD-binding protein, partial [Acidiferrobacteraceae bacterium]|nr:FAD-binding protein [Acidiferrobacteraceae bacterium]
MDGLFTSDYKLEPYWWERTPRPSAKATAPPSEADVAIIGSGYTGLNAALVTARAGRSTVVLDAKDAGYGCSSR